ncbi:MAG: hypothetical protein GX895_09960 [Clostridiales bacterium]|nr:hypothetical protein [Clostridiales bacterium]
MNNIYIVILWILPVVAMFISALVGFFLWLNLKSYRLKKLRIYRKSKIKEE